MLQQQAGGLEPDVRFAPKYFRAIPLDMLLSSFDHPARRRCSSSEIE